MKRCPSRLLSPEYDHVDIVYRRCGLTSMLDDAEAERDALENLLARVQNFNVLIGETMRLENLINHPRRGLPSFTRSW